jgi:hypothetical protein
MLRQERARNAVDSYPGRVAATMTASVDPVERRQQMPR